MWVAAAWTCVALWASVSFLLPCRGMEMTAWQKVQVEEARFTETVTGNVKTLPRTFTGVACSQEIWCSLWCFADTQMGILTNLIVSPSYITTEPVAVPMCYTKMRKDLAFGADVTSSPPSIVLPLRVPNNLVDGYYDHNIKECAYVTHVAPDGAWLQIDLRFILPVAEVLLKAQPDDLAGTYFHDIEVRLGVSPVPSPGVFSSFTLLGTYVGPAQNGMTLTMRTAQPIMARYVSIQLRSIDDLQICHLEIR